MLLLRGIEVVLRQQGGDEVRCRWCCPGRVRRAWGLATILGDDPVVEISRVGEVTVVRQAERAVRGGTEGGLCVSPVGCAGGGIRAADSVVAGHGTGVASSKTWETSPYLCTRGYVCRYWLRYLLIPGRGAGVRTGRSRVSFATSRRVPRRRRRRRRHAGPWSIGSRS